VTKVNIHIHLKKMLIYISDIVEKMTYLISSEGSSFSREKVAYFFVISYHLT
jgi:hypothetical protein